MTPPLPAILPKRLFVIKLIVGMKDLPVEGHSFFTGEDGSLGIPELCYEEHASQVHPVQYTRHLFATGQRCWLHEEVGYTGAVAH